MKIKHKFILFSIFTISLCSMFDNNFIHAERKESLLGEIESILNIKESGVSKHIPWNGYWWSYELNGIAFRWRLDNDSQDSVEFNNISYKKLAKEDLSPVEKYDLVLKRNPTLFGSATAWERANHGNSDGVESWFGHCNAWAGAACLLREPQKTVNYKGIMFYPADIQALVTEQYMEMNSQMIGERNEGPEGEYSGTTPQEKKKNYMKAEEDINPGLFLSILNEHLAIKKNPFVVDVDPDVQVWNHPVFSYEITEAFWENQYKTKMRLQVSVKIVSDGVHPQGVPVGTSKIKHILVGNVESNGKRDHTSKIEAHYVMSLKVKKEDDFYKIIDGDWVGASIYDHPDFVWFPISDEEPSYDYENKYIDSKIVEFIYKKSY